MHAILGSEENLLRCGGPLPSPMQPDMVGCVTVAKQERAACPLPPVPIHACFPKGLDTKYRKDALVLQRELGAVSSES